MTKGEKETVKRLKAMGEEKMFAYIFKRFDELVEAEKQALKERTEATDALWELRAQVTGEKRSIEELVEAEKQAVVEGLFERIMHDSTCHSGGDPLYTCTCGVLEILS